MNNNNDSIIKQRIQELEQNTFTPEQIIELMNMLAEHFNGNDKALKLIKNINDVWSEELLESFKCIDKLQTTLIQYEEELNLLMDQMEGLVKCSILIKQYSLYLKDEVDKIADKIDRQGLDERIDKLVDLLEDIKPRKHLSVVREASVLDFPQKK